jgi:hypothetical protein
MIGTGTYKTLLAVGGCLLLASCGAAKSATPPAVAAPAATSSAAAPAATSSAAAPVTPAAASTAAAAATAATSAATAGAVAAGGSGTTACGLVTEQDASAALGRAAGHGTPGGTAALSECIYDDGSLIVSEKADSKSLYDTSYAQAKAKGATILPGIGDSAFQYSASTTFSGLEFLKGTTLVNILVGGAGARDAALAVAKSAASKM